MKPLKFKSIVRKKMADTVTPVGLYLKFRDKYPHTILLESSDYHSKEQSFSFLCIEPMIVLEIQKNIYNFLYKDKVLQSCVLKNRNFYQIHQDYTNLIDLDCEKATKKFNGLYGYMTYDCVQYFEDIVLQNKVTPADIPLMRYSFYRYIIAINHFNDELFLIENVPQGEDSQIKTIENLMQSHRVHTRNFSLQEAETSNCTDEQFKQYVVQGKRHCKRGNVFQIVLSRQFRQAYKGDEFNVYRALRSINPSPIFFILTTENIN